MERICYNCKKDLQNEPAIKGLFGLLCFPCRYNFDRCGGEEYVTWRYVYNLERGDWEQKYGKQYQKYLRLEDFRALIVIVYVLFALLSFAVLARSEINDSLVLFGLLLVAGGILIFVITKFIDKYRCPPPPPLVRKNALKYNPQVVFSPQYDNHRKGDKFDFGYPIDWEELTPTHCQDQFCL